MVQLQSETSSVCGHYCIMFLYYMSSGLGFKKFLDNFSNNLVNNDKIVKDYIQYKESKNDFYGSGYSYARCLQDSCAKMSLL